MDERRFYVYVLFRPDGSPCYVGKGRGKRWLHHEKIGSGHYNKHLARIIANSGGELPKVKIREGLTTEEAAKIEIAFIKAIGRAPNGPLANLTDGGDGKQGYVTPASTRLKIARANAGKTLSEETRARMSRSAPKRKSDAHRVAIGEALTGRPFSFDHLKNLRIAQNQRWERDEEREKLRRYHAGLTEEQRKARGENIRRGMARKSNGAD